MVHVVLGGGRGDDLDVWGEELPAVGVVAIGVGVDGVPDRRIGAKRRHRVEHLLGEVQVVERVDEQGRAVADDEAGVAPAIASVRREPGVDAVGHLDEPLHVREPAGGAVLPRTRCVHADPGTLGERGRRGAGDDALARGADPLDLELDHVTGQQPAAEGVDVGEPQLFEQGAGRHRPRADDVAGLEDDPARDEGDKLGEGPVHAPGAAGADDLAVDAGLDGQIEHPPLVEAQLVGRDEPRPQGQGAVLALALADAERALEHLVVAGRPVVVDREAGDGVGGPLDGEVAAPGTDHGPDLQLEVEPRASRWHLDIVAGADHARWAGEVERGNLVPVLGEVARPAEALLAVAHVVEEPQAVADRRRPRDRRAQGDVLDGERLGGRLEQPLALLDEPSPAAGEEVDERDPGGGGVDRLTGPDPDPVLRRAYGAERRPAHENLHVYRHTLC